MEKSKTKTIYGNIDAENNGLTDEEKLLLTDAWMCFVTGNGIKNTGSKLVNTILYILINAD